MEQGRVFHSPNGDAGFLAFRRTRLGGTEVVYDDGKNARTVWLVDAGPLDEEGLADALKRAVGAQRVVPALMAELEKRAIRMDAIRR